MTAARTGRRRLGLAALVLLVVGCGGGVGNAGPVARFTGPPGASSSPPAGSGLPAPSVIDPPTPVASVARATPTLVASSPDTNEPDATPTPVPTPTRTPRPHTPSPSPTPVATPRHTSSPSPISTAPTTPPPSPTPTATPLAKVTLSVYFLIDDGTGTGASLVAVAREVDATPRVADAALRELLKGPDPDEIAEPAGSAAPYSLIPADTFLLGLELVDGVATVDLTREFEAGAESSVMARRLAQVVYTLTQFRTITGVQFKLDGEPVPVSSGDGTPLDGPATRADYLALLPSVFVDSPAWGATVERPIVIRGKANVFEAVFQLRLTDDEGRVIDRRRVTATCGTGCWGDWQVELDVADTATERLWIVVWVPSAVDGSPQELRRYPITLPPAG